MGASRCFVLRHQTSLKSTLRIIISYFADTRDKYTKNPPGVNYPSLNCSPSSGQ